MALIGTCMGTKRKDHGMSHSDVDTSDFFGAAIPGVKFGNPGDSVTGVVTAKEPRQQTDPKTSALLYWPDRRPKMMVIVTLLVQDATEDDPGVRNLYVRGYMQQAIRDALREEKMADLAIGSTLQVTFTGTDPPKGSIEGAKRYVAKVTA